ncbi:hypothetical protein KR009_009772, partial [Drosophila setifemur]
SGGSVNSGLGHNGMQQHGAGNMLHHNSNSSSLLLDHSDLGLVGSGVSSGHQDVDAGNHSLEDNNKSPLDSNSTPLANSSSNNNNNNDNDDEDVID